MALPRTPGIPGVCVSQDVWPWGPRWNSKWVGSRAFSVPIRVWVPRPPLHSCRNGHLKCKSNHDTLLLPEVKHHTSDFRVKDKFLTRFTRPSDLAHASPSKSALGPLFFPFSRWYFHPSRISLWFYFHILFLFFRPLATICNKQMRLSAVPFLSLPLGVICFR